MRGSKYFWSAIKPYTQYIQCKFKKCQALEKLIKYNKLKPKIKLNINFYLIEDINSLK